jgi:hypothetical protein
MYFTLTTRVTKQHMRSGFLYNMCRIRLNILKVPPLQDLINTNIFDNSYHTIENKGIEFNIILV